MAGSATSVSTAPNAHELVPGQGHPDAPSVGPTPFSALDPDPSAGWAKSVVPRLAYRQEMADRPSGLLGAALLALTSH